MNLINCKECDITGNMPMKKNQRPEIGIIEINKKISKFDKQLLSKSHGIYFITNKINGKKYVGSTCDSFLNRLYRHRNLLSKNKHHCFHLQNAWNKYGGSNFLFKIVENHKLKNKFVTLNREQYYLDTLKDKYNECKQANSVFGRKMKEKTKQLLSESRRGCKSSSYDHNKYVLYHPKFGIRVDTKYNLSKNNNFDDSSICKLCLGKKIFYKKWICVGKEKEILNLDKSFLEKKYSEKIALKQKRRRYNRTIYNFINILTKEKYVGTLYEFSDSKKLKIKSIRKICYKTGDIRKTLFGWKCLNPK